jgi:hypothetical protein
MNAEAWEVLDAHAGGLHRDLVHALQQAACIEREAARHRQVEPLGAAVVEAAVAYWQAHVSQDTAAILDSFVALGRAVEAWEGRPVRSVGD